MSPEEKDVLRFTNVDQDGAVISEDDMRLVYMRVSRFWHTDGSHQPSPTWLSLLYCVQPQEEGDTCFADMMAAYEALPDDRKRLLDAKSMVHSYVFLRRREPRLPPMENASPPVTHPVVRTWPNGRKSLYLNDQVCYYVGGMSLADGQQLHAELMEHATQPAFVYRHHWTPRDLAMWDNRATMHRVMPYDYGKPRVMHRAEISRTEYPA